MPKAAGKWGIREDLSGEGFDGKILDTQKVLDGVWIHHVKMASGTLKSGDPVMLSVGKGRRRSIMRNHTATHLMFAGLRHVLGDHVTQRGSRQDADGTRFDFSHPRAMTTEEIVELEEWVNRRIWAALPVTTHILSKEDAMKSGAVAQFGEKYGDDVRVVRIGEKQASLEGAYNPQRGMNIVKRLGVITEDLCGGTHVRNTGRIGLFKVVQESSLAAGIRRIEAKTHIGAWKDFSVAETSADKASKSLNVRVDELAERVQQLQKENKKLKQEAKKNTPATAGVS